MGYWKKHPRKDLEAVLNQFHERGWRVEDPPKYYTVKCPCPRKHMTSIHLTPWQNHGKQRLVWAKAHCPLWEEDAR